jgi:chromosome segregation ATPase
MDDLEESAQWHDRTDGRIATLERVSREHNDKVTEHGAVLGSIKSDLKDLRADFGVQKTLIQAVHDVQSDHTARLTRLEDSQAEMKIGMAAMEMGMAEMTAGLQTIIGLLDREIDDQTE